MLLVIIECVQFSQFFSFRNDFAHVRSCNNIALTMVQNISETSNITYYLYINKSILRNMRVSMA